MVSVGTNQSTGGRLATAHATAQRCGRRDNSESQTTVFAPPRLPRCSSAQRSTGGSPTGTGSPCHCPRREAFRLRSRLSASKATRNHPPHSVLMGASAHDHLTLACLFG